MTRGLSIDRPARPDRAERFRRAEAAVWQRHGLVPTERVFDIAEPSIRLRALEVGRGKPILLVHGTVGPAAWPSLIEAMGGGGRFIVLDRPGWGGSDSVDFGRSADDHRLAADVLGGALDALEIEQATVFGGSIGDVWALSLAEHRPSRVSRVVLLGAGPLRADVRPPGFIRILASPIGRLIVRLPMSADRTRSILAASGHASSLADGRIPDELIDYRVSLTNDTHAMRHERTMISHLLSGSGWRPGLPFDDRALAGIGAPTLFVYGTNDDVGDVATWQSFVAAMPHAELEIVEGAGHMPWFDAPRVVAGAIDRFLDLGDASTRSRA